MQRRDLLKASAAWTAASYSRILGAGDRIRIAGLGVGGRATYLLGVAAKAENTEIVAVCDVSEPRRIAAREKFAPGGKAYLDYREVLSRNDVDAVVVGAPDHWHVPITIDAVKAGKDVYVEKPVSHTIEEGERVEQAVLASKQIVQAVISNAVGRISSRRGNSWPAEASGRSLWQ
jgi:predicted dehydrogenase